MKTFFKSLLAFAAIALLSLNVSAQPGPPDNRGGGPPDSTPPGQSDNPPGNRGGARRGPPGEDFIPPGQDPDFVPPGRDVASRMRGDDRPRFRGGPSGRRGLSSIARLAFTQRDPETGEPLEEGSWGLLIYRWIAPEFDSVFGGRELEPGSDWTLTYQPQVAGEVTEDEDGNEVVEFLLPADSGIICLGGGIVNEEGDLNFQDSFDIGTDLPAEGDANEDEAVLALVVSDDVDCEAGLMLAWVPEEYLFGTQGMFYVRADGIPDEDDEEEEEEDEEEDDEEEDEDDDD